MKASDSDGLTYRRLFPRIIITILILVIFSVAPSICIYSYAGRRLPSHSSL
jgi:hypothetical protein